jgi:hypothetical protein
MGCHAGVYAKGGIELKAKNPNMTSGYRCIRDDDGTPRVFWMEMERSGGGWAIVSRQDMVAPQSITYPGSTKAWFQRNMENVFPNADKSINILNTRTTRWPKYREYMVANYSDTRGYPYDSSLSEGTWVHNTGNFGEVEVDMIGFLLNKNDMQEGRASNDYVLYNGVPWADSNGHHAYNAYLWFGKNSSTYNHWGQQDMYGHLISSTDLFRIASDGPGFARTAGCGTGWASNACRQAKSAYVNRNHIQHFAVFGVRR